MAPTNSELVNRNERYSTTHSPMPTIDEAMAAGGSAPKTAVITCIDPRVKPDQFLGLNTSESFVFRTLAGHPQSALEDLATLDIDATKIEDVMIIHHTDCGALRLDTDNIRPRWVERDPASAEQSSHKTFGAVDKRHVDEAIRMDVEWLKQQPLLRSGRAITINGYLYDIKTGKLRLVA